MPLFHFYFIHFYFKKCYFFINFCETSDIKTQTLLILGNVKILMNGFAHSIKRIRMFSFRTINTVI